MKNLTEAIESSSTLQVNAQLINSDLEVRSPTSLSTVDSQKITLLATSSEFSRCPRPCLQSGNDATCQRAP